MYSHRIPWLLAAALALAALWMWDGLNGARQAAEMERGRVVELQRQREVAERDAADARRLATAYGDSVVLAREAGARIAAEAQRRAAAARQRAETAEGRVRATLDSLGASQADLDSLVTAHHDEVAAVREELGAVRWERDVLTRYAERMEDALRQTDAVAAALRAERDSYRRQAEAWARARSRDQLTMLAAGVVVAVVAIR